MGLIRLLSVWSHACRNGPPQSNPRRGPGTSLLPCMDIPSKSNTLSLHDALPISRSPPPPKKEACSVALLAFVEFQRCFLYNLEEPNFLEEQMVEVW